MYLSHKCTCESTEQSFNKYCVYCGRQLTCDRTTLHKHLFISYIFCDITWVLYYVTATLDVDVLVHNPVSDVISIINNNNNNNRSRLVTNVSGDLLSPPSPVQV